MLRSVPVKSQPAPKHDTRQGDTLQDGTLRKWLAGLATLGALLYFGFRR